MAQDAVIHGRGEAGERQVQGEGEGVNGFRKRAYEARTPAGAGYGIVIDGAGTNKQGRTVSWRS
jgi:hypothetical protein